MRLNWTDEYLSWDPSQYEDLRQIHFSPKEIWRPDIHLYNNADSSNMKVTLVALLGRGQGAENAVGGQYRSASDVAIPKQLKIEQNKTKVISADLLEFDFDLDLICMTF